MKVGIDEGNRAREQRLLDQMTNLSKPALVVSIADDPWATEYGVRRAVHAYRNLAIVRRVIDYAPSTQRHVGHWGFFRRSSAAALWPLVLQFIEPVARTPRTSVGA